MAHLADRLAAAVARWNAGDLAGYLDLYAPGIRLHGYAPEPMDKAAVAGFYTAVFAAMGGPDGPPRLVIDDVFESGDRLACRFTLSGTQTGPFLGLPATGRSYVLPGITILRFEGPQVAERWSQTDMLGLMTQLGALPPPA